MRLSLAVMAHPARTALVAALLPSLPGARVVWDEKNDRWDTGRRSMLAFDPEADWHVVVQDDVILCRDFVKQATAALRAVTDGPVAFYMGVTARFNGVTSDTAMRRARRRNQKWVMAPGPYWGPAVAVRPADIPPMIEWCDARPDVLNYDRRMSRYFGAQDRKCWYSVPCLVEHRVGAENPSLVPGRGHSRRRTAAWFSPEGRPNW